jgi:uncharacterized membrane protein
MTVKFTSTSACGTQTVLGSSRLTLQPGESVQVTCAYPIAPDACPGVYTVTITATSNRGVLGTASTPLTVTQ